MPMIDEQHRLDQRDEPLQVRLDLLVVEVAPGCSASPAARRSTRRPRPSSRRRPGTRRRAASAAGERLALAHALRRPTSSSPRPCDRLPIDRGGDVERVDQRDAAAEQRRQRARHLRRRELPRGRPERPARRSSQRSSRARWPGCRSQAATAAATATSAEQRATASSRAHERPRPRR